jgi:HEAT repeat protein
MYDESEDRNILQYWQTTLIDLLWRKSLSAIHQRTYRPDIPALQKLLADQQPELRHLVDMALDLQIRLSIEKFKHFLRLLPDLSRDSSTHLLLAIVEKRSTDLFWEAMIQLGKQQEKRAVQPLLALLTDQRGWVRLGAAHALGRIGDKQGVEPLLPLLLDERDDIRWTVVSALTMVGDKRAAKPMVDMLQDPSPTVRRFVHSALRRFEDLDTVEPLLVILSKPVPLSLEEAVLAVLGIPGAYDAVEPLIARLNSDHTFVRSLSVIALGKIGDRRAIGPLLALFESQEPELQAEIIEALVSIGGDNIEQTVLTIFRRQTSAAQAEIIDALEFSEQTTEAVKKSLFLLTSSKEEA